jgi:hypothetical protein
MILNTSLLKILLVPALVEPTRPTDPAIPRQ